MPTSKLSDPKSLPSESSSVKILPPAWFARPTCVVAADLVGKVLCRQLMDSDGTTKVLRMRICETESYIGDADGSVQAHLARKEKRTLRSCIAKAGCFMSI